MFAGVGGFSIGIDRAYDSLRPVQSDDTERPDSNDKPPNKQQQRKHLAHCVGLSEIDKYASAVLAYRYPQIKNYGDCTKIDWSSVPDFNLLVGGSPCQDFSIAGKRLGLCGERSGLFVHFVKALQEKKPQYFIWENVKGVLSSRGGWDFANIQAALAEAGYSLWWQVLNAKDFGVPQNRERVFIVGTRGERGREVFFETGAGEEDTRKNGTDVSYALDAQYSKEANRADKCRRQMVAYGSSQDQKISALDGQSQALSAGHFNQPKVAVKRQPLKFMERNQKNIEGDYAFTVDTANTGGVKIDDGNVRIRRLTPTECERLMSWPDGWTQTGNMSDTQRYKMCGNGVVSEVVAHVVKELIIDPETRR